MSLIITSEPATEPVSAAEQKSHSRVDISDDDTLISGLIKASRINIEDLTGQKFITQTWKMSIDKFPAEDYILLPFYPIISVDSITTIDVDGDEAVFSSDNYETDLISIPARIKLKENQSWTIPADDYRALNGVEIVFKAGYGAASDVPEILKLAIKMLTAHFYENRESTTVGNLKELPMGIKSLLSSYRTWLRRL